MNNILNGTLGFGTAPLGNMYRDIPEEEALATVDAAWEHGIRYFDTAPFYGAGLAELRLGKALDKYNREDYVLSTKVGRYMLDEKEKPSSGELFEHGRDNKVVTDYSADATLRSIEQSLERLNTDRLDFVYVHDVSPDFHGDEWLSHFETARTGAFRELTRLREEGVIKSWGLGVNRCEPIELTMELEEANPDLCLLAGRYTLLSHEQALQRLLPRAVKQNVKIVAGGPYNSGVLVGGSHYEYAEASPEIVERVKRIQHIADSYGISVKAAALQFTLAHPAVAAAIPGGSRPERIKEDQDALKEDIPASFWQEMREQKIIALEAPTPVQK
ncbi:aldo/keto reductase [Halobacillus massiliensis]|uniref:aldo/keto reductase n=1 Tax=Halobacillus massiliensis TaxID=1926286 RepID=UPI0009E3F980|nr:aldo/keto reductase [Halobacillus massiliensis]